MPSSYGATLRQQVQERESAGDLAGARAILEHPADTSSASSAEETARFMDRHGDPMLRDAYLKWAAAETDPERKRAALREIVLIDVNEGKPGVLDPDLDAYRAAGGNDLEGLPKHTRASSFSTILIPGPLSSFARMAALAPDVDTEDLLPALARNIVTNGFEAAGNELLQPTEYLRLLLRYVGQARDLQALATGEHKIVIPSCDSEQTGNLLKVLGYRMRGSCGSDLVLETVNPTRAFLTVDSGFPLTQLEQDLRANHRFELPYAPTAVPVLYTAEYWLSAAGRPSNSDFLDAFTAEPALCRLYLGLSHVDREVAEALRKQVPANRLRLYANVLDFYGSLFRIREGMALVPGPSKAWSSLAGASPSNPGAFFEKLLTTDDGWLASYFDALSRMEDGPVFAYLTQPERLRRFYDALRGKITSPGPARPVFRSSTDLMLFTTSLRAESNGVPHIPGNLEVWRTLFIKHPHGKYDGKLTRSAASWKGTDDLLEALFALSRKAADNEPLHIFLALNDVDRWRAKSITPELAARLINEFKSYGAQYRLFAEEASLSEASISAYLDLCSQVFRTRDVMTRADRVGSAQALVGLWSILCRQNSIPASQRDGSFLSLVRPFLDAESEADVFVAARKGVDTLLAAAPESEGASRQEKLISLLVGPVRTADEGAPAAPATAFLRMFDAQLLFPIDALFSAADRLGKGELDARVGKLFSDRLNRMQEAESLHNSISRDEKNTFAMGYWSERHVDVERKFTLEGAGKNSDRKDARGALAPFLRDTLVGMLYCYYAPAGAEILLTNPDFVRSHDFVGPESSPGYWRGTEVASLGWPANAGGKLGGSLVELPYALAQAEQNFLTPRKEQALIWADLVPQLIIDITVTRWRNVTPEQLRWVGLHVRRGRNLLAAAALSPAIETSVAESLERFLTPGQVQRVQDLLHSDTPNRAAMLLPPSFLYALASDPKLKGLSPDVTSSEISGLAASDGASLTPQAISRAFGTPKPTLTHSYSPSLLYLRTFPTLMGYSSRLMAESWESNNLYYAFLADKAAVPVDRLDAYVSEWNRTAIENIFATHLEDWPALIRSLNVTADSVLHPNIGQTTVSAPGN